MKTSPHVYRLSVELPRILQIAQAPELKDATQTMPSDRKSTAWAPVNPNWVVNGDGSGIPILLQTSVSRVEWAMFVMPACAPPLKAGTEPLKLRACPDLNPRALPPAKTYGIRSV